MQVAHGLTVRTPGNRYAIIADVKREPWESACYIAREVGGCQQRVPEGLDDQFDRYHYLRDDRLLHLFT